MGLGEGSEDVPLPQQSRSENQTANGVEIHRRGARAHLREYEAQRRIPQAASGSNQKGNVDPGLDSEHSQHSEESEES